MATPDPSLGFTVDFPEQDFRNAMSFAMQMGAANAEGGQSLKPVFMFSGGGLTYYRDGVLLDPPPRLDRDGRPFDPTVEIRRAVGRAQTADCAVEIEQVRPDELPVGNFRPTRAVVTLLDDQYLLVKGCREMIYNNDTFRYDHEPEVSGLFGVNVHTLVFFALKDS